MEDLSSGLGDRCRYPSEPLERMRFGIKTAFLLITMLAVGLAFFQMHRRHKESTKQAYDSVSDSPNYLGYDEYDPVKLVRAVNHLQTLGKNESLRVLKKFHAANKNDGYTSPHQSVVLIVPFLFDRIDTSEGYPLPKNRYDSEANGEFSLAGKDWGLYIEVVDGIPFHTVLVGTSGWPPDREYLLKWAEKRGKIRVKTMKPSDDPFLAADTLIAKLNNARGDEEGLISEMLINHIRFQVFRSMSHLPTISGDNDENLPFDNERWRRLEDSCKSQGLFWDTKSQQYDFGKPAAKVNDG